MYILWGANTKYEVYFYIRHRKEVPYLDSACEINLNNISWIRKIPTAPKISDS